MTQPSYDVFLSYSSKDKHMAASVNLVQQQLTAHKFTVFLDTLEVLGGDDIVTSVFASISRCRYFVIFLTPNSVASKWVKEELSTAKVRELEGKVVILPLLYEDCDPPEPLLSTRWIDFRHSFDHGCEELLHTLQEREGRRNEAFGQRPPSQPAQTNTLTLGDTKFKLLTAIRGDE